MTLHLVNEARLDTAQFHLYETSGIGKSTHTKSSCQGLGEGVHGGGTASWVRGSLEVDRDGGCTRR